eukprot:365417-Chlamydomonas_euryale.AAC.23
MTTASKPVVRYMADLCVHSGCSTGVGGLHALIIAVRPRHGMRQKPPHAWPALTSAPAACGTANRRRRGRRGARRRAIPPASAAASRPRNSLPVTLSQPVEPVWPARSPVRAEASSAVERSGPRPRRRDAAQPRRSARAPRRRRKQPWARTTS